MKNPHFLGIRHLSPAGAYFLRAYLEEKQPKLVLIEGPSDFDDMLKDMVRQETKPPIAILAYTKAAPVRTILYPFAEYSPEYQAVCWCHEKKTECHFIDLPSETFLAIPEKVYLPGSEDTEGEEGRISVYHQLDEKSKEDGHETFWERVMEHVSDSQAYHQGANSFGTNLRELTEGVESDWAETVLRESYMRHQIKNAVERGIAPEDIVVVTGSYHVEGLKSWKEETDDLSGMPRTDASHTLMPYSYYRLSSRSGYGAGNKAPAYYALLWEGFKQKEPQYAVLSYLSKIAAFQRGNGNPVSSASVIEAARLANALAQLRGGIVPVLRDLRDAALTCLGEGSFPAISLATADTEIGTAIGALPDGVSRTSIQEDFYRQLKDLKLEKYRDLTAQDLTLDLRENRRVSSEKAAFLDLHRSFFLHCLRVLHISFAKKQQVSQENATWSEHWIVQWTPEAEIELVESALKGDTVALAASFAMKEKVENAADMGTIAEVIEDAFSCGMEAAANYATIALQKMAINAASGASSLKDLADTAHRLSVIVQYGNIRKVDSAPLVPILQQLYYRSCLTLADACVCDDAASKTVIESMERLNAVALAHDFLNSEEWVQVLSDVAQRDDLNTKLSGFAAAILLERGKMTTQQLKTEVERRLSKGIPADLGASWFEGLAMKNQYALIARLSLWESLDEYLETLDDEEFKRALVFLRRAFADFSAREKDEIAENLGEIWGLNKQEVSEILNATLDDTSQQIIDSLDDFDFDI